MTRISRAWAGARRLSNRERWLLARVLVLLPVTVASLRVLGYNRTRVLLSGPTPSPHARVDLSGAQSLARIVHGAAPWSPLAANCLPRAMVLYRLLRQQGLDATLQLGVDRPAGLFAAHAWVEHAGIALGEPEQANRSFLTLRTPGTGDAV